MPSTLLDPLRAGELGFTPAELLQLVRVFVLVEGTHDEAVINALAKDCLDTVPARVVVMGGGRNSPAVLDSTVLFDYTDASIFVALDNIDAPAVEACWKAACLRLQSDGVTRALKELLPLKESTREMEWLYNLGYRAIKQRRQARVTIFGLSRPDIIEYLPADQLVPGADSWETLVDEWGHRGDFKEFLRREKGGRIHVTGSPWWGHRGLIRRG